MAATGHFSWPPAGSFMAVSGQFLVAAVTFLLDVRSDPRHYLIAW